MPNCSLFIAPGTVQRPVFSATYSSMRARLSGLSRTRVGMQQVFRPIVPDQGAIRAVEDGSRARPLLPGCLYRAAHRYGFSQQLAVTLGSNLVSTQLTPPMPRLPWSATLRALDSARRSAKSLAGFIRGSETRRYLR